ncbi:MAG: peptidylprolyl isomerase [Deltaproteobacteria bacterium]|nr:peptidylprolyl isomerase [Deltaproteobacteria bacterium]
MIDKFKGFFLVLLVVLLSAVFALQFGGGQAEGCAAGGTTYLARVYDQTLSKGDFEAAYSVANFGRLPEETQRSMRLPQLVLDGLIDRTLLAREARKVGFEVGQDEVMSRFVNDGIILLSLGVGAPPMLPQGEIPVSFTDKEGAFNKDLAERYIQNGLRRSVGEFAAAQVDEYLAAQMRELVASSVNVSEAEVWDDYVRENDNAKIKYVRFSPAYYSRQKPETTEAALAAWKADNEDRLTAEYETNKHRYTNLEKQVRARHILIKAGSQASAEQKEEAQKRAEALQKRAAKGEDFAGLASKHSDDQITANKGGDIGFLRKGTMPESFDEALFSTEVGAISEVVETPYGFHVITVLAIREGDVPIDEAKHELAEGLYRADWLEARARKAAASTLASWQQSKDDDAVAQTLATAAKQHGSESALTPSLEETVDFGRSDSPVPGISTPALLDVVFAVPEGEAFPAAPVKLGAEWVIFRLIDRQRPDQEAFTEAVQGSTREVLQTLKKKETVDLYIQQLRAQATADKALRVHALPTEDDRS